MDMMKPANYRFITAGPCQLEGREGEMNGGGGEVGGEMTIMSELTNQCSCLGAHVFQAPVAKRAALSPCGCECGQRLFTLPIHLARNSL